MNIDKGEIREKLKGVGAILMKPDFKMTKNFMSRINLSAFDPKFLETIKDYKKVHLNPTVGIYYTIMLDKDKAGVIGFKIKESKKHFLKIGIRGQGIFAKALKLLANKHKIKKIYSTVAMANIASARAHEKAGFKRIPKNQEEFLKEKGLLLKRNMRLVKTFAKEPSKKMSYGK